MLTGHEPCEASVQSIHKIYRALPENISQNTMDAIICGMQRMRIISYDVLLIFKMYCRMENQHLT